jgi:hypothetical protein
MNRKLFGILAVAAAAFAFAGCDALLETMYPEFGKKDFAKEGITVRVEVANDFNYFESAQADSFAQGRFIRAKLVPIYETGSGQYIDFGAMRENKFDRAALSSKGYTKPSGNLEFKFDAFTNLASAEWAVIVWLDKNDDNSIGTDEPSTLALNPGSGQIVDFRWGANAADINAFLNPYTRVDPWILSLLYGGGSSGGPNTPPVPVISDFPAAIQANKVFSVQGYQSYDPDVNDFVMKWEWSIVQNNAGVRNEIAHYVNGTSNLDLVLPAPGFYEINLKVFDKQNQVSAGKAQVIIEATSGAVVNNQIHITGSDTSSAYGGPVRFALVDRYSRMTKMLIDTYSTSFDNVFMNVPAGQYYVFAWLDANNDKAVDPGEPAYTATNTSQSWLVDTIGGTNVNYFDYPAGAAAQTWEAAVSLFDGAVLPSGFFPTAAEANAGSPYTVSIVASHQLNSYTTMSGAGRQVRVRLYDESNNMVQEATGPYYMDGSAYLAIGNVFGTLSYQPSPGLYYVEVQLDLEGNNFEYGLDRVWYGDLYLLAGDTTVDMTIYEYDWWDADYGY